MHSSTLQIYRQRSVIRVPKGPWQDLHLSNLGKLSGEEGSKDGTSWIQEVTEGKISCEDDACGQVWKQCACEDPEDKEWYLESGTGSVNDIWQYLNRLLEHDPKRACRSITAKSSVILGYCCIIIFNDLKQRTKNQHSLSMIARSYFATQCTF